MKIKVKEESKYMLKLIQPCMSILKLLNFVDEMKKDYKLDVIKDRVINERDEF